MEAWLYKIVKRYLLGRNGYAKRSSVFPAPIVTKEKDEVLDEYDAYLVKGSECELCLSRTYVSSRRRWESDEYDAYPI